MVNTNELELYRYLIKREKFYSPPPNDGKDIKQLFTYAVERGIGQPVDDEGVPKNQWTPEALADAISMIDHPDASTNIRSVQYWFDSKNDRNISPNNCRWLARVFGCGDPDAISDWQTALLAARRLFIENRRADASRTIAATNEGDNTKTADIRLNVGSPAEATKEYAYVIQPHKARSKHRLSRRLELLFADPIILSVVVWFWLTGILFFTAVLDVLSVSYTTPDGTSKQVGYLWNPSWIIHDLVLLPAFLMVVSRVINFWKNEARLLFLDARSKRSAYEGWITKVSSLSILHWVALAISVFFVFLLQWVGGYLFPILNHELGTAAVSWVNIILARPDIMSVGSALTLSGIYFLFAALVFFCLNAGFAFLYAVWSDFSDLYMNAKALLSEHDDARMRFVGIKLVDHIFLGTVLALWISTSIKLYSMYISVNSKDILTWISNDFRQLLGNADQHEKIIVGYSLSQFSTIIFTCVIAGVFLYVYLNARTLFTSHDYVFDSAPWGRWLSAIIFLLVNYLCVGQVVGFSILLLLSIVVTAYCVYAHRVTTQGLDQKIHGTSAAKQRSG